jgi:hypothetical protein
MPNATRLVALSLLVAALALTAPAAQAQIAPGSCSEAGSATADIDINNVSATLHNNGNLFYPGSGAPHYEIPKGSELSSNFASGIWVGGQVNDELRMAAATYSNYEFRPGPLNEQGQPVECNGKYDRIYTVRERDVQYYDETGEAVGDLADWPVDLGAPVIDGDGTPGNYNLEGGDRPDLRGHQTSFWVMNDVAPPHRTTQTPPIGLEVRVTAYASASTPSTKEAVGNSTLYRYELVHEGDAPLDSAFVGLWADTDIGGAGDDYVGSDPERDLGFGYNGDASDGNYGNPPPALGYDVLQGPLATGDGADNDGDGQTDEAGERLGLSKFVYYNNDASPTGNPDNAADYYGYLRGVWKDSTAIQYGGDGYQEGTRPADFIFSADPPDYWSEADVSEETGRQPNEPGDRRFLMSIGPFSMQPGETKSLAFSIVWARAPSASDSAHIASVEAMKQASDVVQAAWKNGYDLPLPDAPTETATAQAPADGAASQPTNPTLRWEAAPGATEYQVQYSTTPFDAASKTLRADSAGTVTVFATSHTLEGLTDSTTYYWRVRGATAGGYGPWSETRQFATSGGALEEAGALRLSDGRPAFMEVIAPNGEDLCPDGGEEGAVCGNIVQSSVNSTEQYFMDAIGPGSEASLSGFAPNNYEIRFTEEGSYVIHPFTSGNITKYPLEVWDIGNQPPGTPNDPSDDVQMVPTIVSGSGDECSFNFGETTTANSSATDRIYAYYPTNNDYEAWESYASDLAGDGCVEDGSLGGGNVDFMRGRPIQRQVIAQFDSTFTVDDLRGTVIRFYTTAFGVQAPVLSAPVNDADIASGTTLYWTGPPGAARYQVQVAEAGSDFSNPLVDADSLEQEQYTLSRTTPKGDYQWRVRASTGQGAAGEWSAVQLFTVTSTGTENVADLPQEVTLRPNYPNPVRQATTLRYGLPQAGTVRLAVYDVLGRRVAMLAEGRKQAAGWHRLRWNAERLASGVYFVRLTTDGEQRTRKVVVVR